MREDMTEEEIKLSKLCKDKSRMELDDILGRKEKEAWEISRAELRLM